MSYQIQAQLSSKNVNTMQLNVADGLAMSRVLEIVCDKQNIIWIKSKNALQFWDGQSIQTFQDSIIDKGQEFQIYEHFEEGIIVCMSGFIRQFSYTDLRKKTLFQSRNRYNDFIPIPFFASSNNAFLIHRDSIYIFNNDAQSEIRHINNNNFQQAPHLHEYTFDGFKYLMDRQSQVCVLNKMESGENSLASVLNDPIRNNCLLDSESIIITTKEGLEITSQSKKSLYVYPNNTKANFYSSILRLSDSKLLVGFDKKLCVFDLIKEKWTSFYKDINQQDLLQAGYFDKLMFDNYKNIWAITVNEGLVKIYNNESFDYYGSEDKKLNFVKNIVVDEASNRIISSALNGGILVYDTLGNQVQHLHAKNTKNLVSSVTGIYKISADKYIYNNHQDSLIYCLELKNNNPIVKPVLEKKESYLYYQDAVQIDENNSILLFNTLYNLQHEPIKLTPLFKYQATKSCILKDKQELWIGCGDGILNIKLSDKESYEFISLPGEGYVRTISKWKDNKLALGTDRGLAIYDVESSEVIAGPEGCIYCLLTDDENNIWAGTGSGLKKFNKDLNIVQFSQIDGLQNNEFNTDACAKAPSGKMYFGGINGITSFYPKKVIDKDLNTSFYIKSLSNGDSMLLKNTPLNALNKFKLDHNQNDINISVGTIGKFESEDYNYQYYAKGLSSKWIDAKKRTTYNFNLAPGEYEFYFLATNTFNPNAKLSNPLKVIVGQPWWSQWWFYLLLTLIAISMITYLIRTREHQKYLKEKFEWDLQTQRQEDRIKMSKELHDNIGSRLTFLVSSIENIKKAFQTNAPQAIHKFDHLTEFGKDTIEDLRSMMWVLNQSSIKLQDLQLKVLDYLNIASNSYKNIEFQYEGPENGLDQQIDSKMSQNIFRIIQESIHNSIKYANPSKILIHVLYENEMINVSIKDDGLGFDINKIERGNGISNMKSRLAAHHSELHMNSEIGKGTTIHFSVDTRGVN